jgi:hypothetical protein
MRLRLNASVCLFLLPSATMAKTHSRRIVDLQDGATITVTGRLEARFTGWDGHLIIRTPKTYRTDYGDDDVRKVREIEIEPSFHRRELSRYVGRSVRAHGKLQLNCCSPYYWNGVMLVPASVQAFDGQLFRPVARPENDPMPATIKSYVYRMKMTPGTFNRPDSAIDLESGRALPKEGTGCMVSGGGAGGVMNCGCADGFTAAKGGISARPLKLTELKPFDDPDPPQLEVPETPKHSVNVELLCVRARTGEK